jgi:hypothetical protein
MAIHLSWSPGIFIAVDLFRYFLNFTHAATFFKFNQKHESNHDSEFLIAENLLKFFIRQVARIIGFEKNVDMIAVLVTAKKIGKDNGQEQYDGQKRLRDLQTLIDESTDQAFILCNDSQYADLKRRNKYRLRF